MYENEIISVIMPVYNADRYLKRAIDSVLAQTYGNWELIIVDDSSNDDTGRILDGISNDKIHVFHNEKNSGTAYSRMRGISESSSSWIAFLDADDMWEKTKLEKQVQLMHSLKNPVLLYTGSRFMDDDGHVFDYVMHVPEKVDFHTLLKQNVISCSSVMIRKEMILKHPFPDVRTIHEDYAVWLNVLRDIKYAYAVDEPLLTYRLTENSKSHNKLKAAFMNWRTYKYANVPAFTAIASMASYAIKGIQKYRKIK